MVRLNVFSQVNQIGLNFQQLLYIESNELDWKNSKTDALNWKMNDFKQDIDFGIIYSRKNFEIQLGINYYKSRSFQENNNLYASNQNYKQKNREFYILKTSITKLQKIIEYKNIQLQLGPTLKLNYRISDKNSSISIYEKVVNNLYSSEYYLNKSCNYIYYSLGIQLSLFYSFRRIRLGLNILNYMTYTPYISTNSKVKYYLFQTEVKKTENSKVDSEFFFEKNIFNLSLYYTL